MMNKNTSIWTISTVTLLMNKSQTVNARSGTRLCPQRPPWRYREVCLPGLYRSTHITIFAMTEIVVAHQHLPMLGRATGDRNLRKPLVPRN